MKNANESIKDICQAVNEYREVCSDIVNDKVRKSELEVLKAEVERLRKKSYPIDQFRDYNKLYKRANEKNRLYVKEIRSLHNEIALQKLEIGKSHGLIIALEEEVEGFKEGLKISEALS